MKKCIVMCTVIASILLFGCYSRVKEKNTETTTMKEEGLQNRIEVTLDGKIENDYNSVDTNISFIMGCKNYIYSLAKSGGYGTNNMFYVADLNTGIQVPLCNNANCQHNDYKCNAYIKNTIMYAKMTEEGIYYIECVLKNAKYGYFLKKISFDGTTITECGELFESYGSVNSFNDMIYKIVDNYLYIRRIEQVVNFDEDSLISEMVEENLSIYRYKIDGSEDIELILKKEINNETVHWREFNVFEGILYYYFDGCRYIDLKTLEDKAITEDMYYVSRYNDEGKILAYIRDNNNVKDYYVFDKKTDEKKHLSEGDVPSEIKKFLENSTTSIISYYIDDKYVYMFEGDNYHQTFVFDHQFNYVGSSDKWIYTTIDDKVIANENGNFVIVERKNIFEDKMDVTTLINVKGEYITLEWPTYLYK